MEAERLPDVDEFLTRAKALGATGAKFISPRTVITAPWVRRGHHPFGGGVDGFFRRQRSLICSFLIREFVIWLSCHKDRTIVIPGLTRNSGCLIQPFGGADPFFRRDGGIVGFC